MKQIKKKKKLISSILLIALVIFIIFIFRSDNVDYRIFEGEQSKVIQKDETRAQQYILYVSSIGTNIHPYAETNAASRILNKLVYESLIQIKEDGSVEYLLAKDIHIQEDGKLLNITLNEDHQFSDGESVNAETIKNAYLWHKDEANQSDYHDLVSNIDTMRITSTYAMEIRLKENTFQLEELLSVPIMHVKEDDSKFGHTFAGSGDYEVDSIYPMQKIDLTAVSGHSNAYKEIILTSKSDAFESLLEKQEVDAFVVSKETMADEVFENKAYDVYEMQDSDQMLLVANTEKLKDKEERKSVFSAFNRQGIFKEACDDTVGIYATGITNARKKGTVFDQNWKYSNVGIKNITMEYAPNGIERHIFDVMKNQCAEKNIQVTGVEGANSSDIQEDVDFYLYTGSYEDLLKTKDMGDLYRQLNDIAIEDYADILERYLGDQAWFIPLYSQTTWVASLHGNNTVNLFQ